MAEPEHASHAESHEAIHLPPPSIWPLLTAIATTILFVTLIFTPWGAVIGTPLLLLSFLGWGWPHGQDHQEERLVEQTG